MAVSSRSDGAPSTEALPHYSFDHLPEDFNVAGGACWASFVRSEPMTSSWENGPSRYLVEARWSRAHLAIGGSDAKAIFIDGDFRAGPAGGTYRKAWLVVWEEALLFVLGDKEFKETYEVALSQMAAELGKVEPAAAESNYHHRVKLQESRIVGRLRGTGEWRRTIAEEIARLIVEVEDLEKLTTKPNAAPVIEGLLRVIRGGLSEGDKQTDIEAAQEWLETVGRRQVEMS